MLSEGFAVLGVLVLPYFSFEKHYCKRSSLSSLIARSQNIRNRFVLTKRSEEAIKMQMISESALHTSLLVPLSFFFLGLPVWSPPLRLVSPNVNTQSICGPSMSKSVHCSGRTCWLKSEIGTQLYFHYSKSTMYFQYWKSSDTCQYLEARSNFPTVIQWNWTVRLFLAYTCISWEGTCTDIRK